MAATWRIRISGGLSGIFRDVYLWSAGSQHIRDFFVRTDLDEDYRDASMFVEMDITNYSAQAAACSVDCDAVGRRGAGGCSEHV